MFESPLWVRVLTGAVVALLLFPSCFTTSLWREGTRSTGPTFESPIATVATPDGGQRILCRCTANPPRSDAWVDPEWPKFADVLAQWQPPLAEGSWVELEAIEHADLAARLWREHPDDCGVHVVRNTDGGAAPRCWFVYPKGYERVDDLPDDFASWPGVHKRGGVIANKLVFEAECRVHPAADPGVAPQSSVGVELREPPHGTGYRVLSTPFTVVFDAALLPIQLISFGAWW